MFDSTKNMPVFSRPIRTTSNEFTADAACPDIGYQRLSERQHILEKGGKKSWFEVPHDFGGGRRNVVGHKLQTCSCKKHTTDVYCLQGDILVYHCITRVGFVWMSK